MPNFRYRALTETGEIVSGLIAAPTSAEVARRIDYLRLVPVDPIVEESSARASRLNFNFEKRVRSEDVTIFTLDLALLLKAGARLDRALELLATDSDIGRLRSTAGAIRSSILAGESFADALAHHPALFSPIYVALVRVGEVSGTLEEILQVLASDRSRAEALRRKVADALRYPAFLLFAAMCVLVFFLMFVLPQFGAVLHDFGAKIDPVAGAFLATLRVHECAKGRDRFGGINSAGDWAYCWRDKQNFARLSFCGWFACRWCAASWLCIRLLFSAAISRFSLPPALPSPHRCGLSPI